MNLKALNTMIDSEAVSQNNTFSHSLIDYEKIYNYLIDQEIESTKEDVENLSKKVSNLQKPIAEFVNACLVNMANPSNDILLKGLIDKAMKVQKFDYASLFSDIASKINPTNKYALNIKAVTLKKLDASIEEQKKAIERYLEQDIDDTKFLVELANLHKKEGKIDNAIIDLKKAIQRSIQKQDFHELKINTLELDNIKDANTKDYIVGTLSRSAKKIGFEKINTLLFDLERRNSDDVDYSIKILKEMLSIDPKNTKAKNILIDQYKKLYGESEEHCIKCLEKSGLLQDVNTAITESIKNFEKLIMFEKDVFVYYETEEWIGRVCEVTDDSLIINFPSKPGHRMSTNLALNRLKILSKDDMRVLKKFANKQKLHDKILSDPRWALVTLIKSEDNSFKLMKDELVPSILTQAEFLNFSTEAKKIIKSDNYISPSVNKTDEFIVRDTPISHEEKLYNSFKSESNNFEKMKIIRNFLQTEGDKESESFGKMLLHFQNFLKSHSPNRNFIYSYLFLLELKRSKHKVKVATSYFPNDDEEVFKLIPENEIIDWYLEIQDNDIRKDYIKLITKSSENWKKILTDIFRKAPSAIISSEFKKMKVDDFDTEEKKQSMFIAKQNPLPFLYYLQLEPNFEGWKDINTNEYNFITTQLDILNTFSQKNAIAGKVYDKLINSGYLEEYIKREVAHISSLFNIIMDNKGIGDEKKINLRTLMLELVPELDQSAKNTTTFPTALLCKQSTYDKKKAELEHIMNVEIPENSKDIATARELGDLKENAEYQYAKEKQKILNATMNKLDEEISKASVVKSEDVDTSKVCYGTKVKTKNSDKTEVVYTILGPWESEPDKNIISFTSPLGRKLYDHTVGEKLEFELNGHPYNFEIVGIDSVDIS